MMTPEEVDEALATNFKGKKHTIYSPVPSPSASDIFRHQQSQRHKKHQEQRKEAEELMHHYRGLATEKPLTLPLKVKKQVEPDQSPELDETEASDDSLVGEAAAAEQIVVDGKVTKPDEESIEVSLAYSDTADESNKETETHVKVELEDLLVDTLVDTSEKSAEETVEEVLTEAEEEGEKTETTCVSESKNPQPATSLDETDEEESVEEIELVLDDISDAQVEGPETEEVITAEMTIVVEDSVEDDVASDADSSPDALSALEDVLSRMEALQAASGNNSDQAADEEEVPRETVLSPRSQSSPDTMSALEEAVTRMEKLTTEADSSEEVEQQSQEEASEEASLKDDRLEAPETHEEATCIAEDAPCTDGPSEEQVSTHEEESNTTGESSDDSDPLVEISRVPVEKTESSNEGPSDESTDVPEQGDSNGVSAVESDEENTAPGIYHKDSVWGEQKRPGEDSETVNRFVLRMQNSEVSHEEGWAEEGHAQEDEPCGALVTKSSSLEGMALTNPTWCCGAFNSSA